MGKWGEGEGEERWDSFLIGKKWGKVEKDGTIDFLVVFWNTYNFCWKKEKWREKEQLIFWCFEIQQTFWWKIRKSEKRMTDFLQKKKMKRELAMFSVF